MKTRRVVSFVGVLVLICGACSSGGPSTQRAFTLQDLLVDVSVFPPGWEESPNGPSADELAPFSDDVRYVARISLVFYTANGVAVEEINQFHDEKEATDEFNQWLEREFAPGDSHEPWFVPTDIQYQSIIADQVHFACGDNGKTFCRFLGQYDEYIVLFNAHTSPNFMTYADFEQILWAIDEQMESSLK